MSALPHQGDHREMQRRLARRGRDGADATFERGDPFFEHGDRRVRYPRINMPGAFEVEQ